MSALIERNPATGRFQRVTPATMARKAQAAKDARLAQEALEALRAINARRERVKGQVGPLTRAELAALVNDCNG